MKSPEAFRGIAEVAEVVGVRQHTLRAWENRFPFLKPVKRPDGRRYYRPSDLVVLREIKRLLEEENRSAEEILAIHRSGAFQPGAAPTPTAAPEKSPNFGAILTRLAEARDRLKAVLAEVR